MPIKSSTCLFPKSSIFAETITEELLRDHPGLKPFVLSDVQLTGTSIGGGAYGRVDEVAFQVSAAAKTIYFNTEEGHLDQSKAESDFVRECQLMSTRTLSSFWASPSFQALESPPSSWRDC